MKTFNRFTAIDIPVLLRLFLRGEGKAFSSDSLLTGASSVIAPLEDKNGDHHRTHSVKDAIFLTAGELPGDQHRSFDLICAAFESKAVLDGYQRIPYRIITNPDGSIRWMVPVTNRRASFLQFYNSSTVKGRIFSAVASASFLSGVPGIVCNGYVTIYVRENPPLFSLLRDASCKTYSIFTGTIGENRKCVIEISDDGKTSCFIKVPLNRNSAKLLENESRILHVLNMSDFSYLRTPYSEFDGLSGSVRLENIRPEKADRYNGFNGLHMKGLLELYLRSISFKPLRKTAFYERLIHNMYLLKGNAGASGRPEIKRIYAGLERLFHSIDADRSIPVADSHGDFTPWNLYQKDGMNYVYDWELSTGETPLLYDLFHYIFQGEVMLHRSAYSGIEEAMERAMLLPDVQSVIQTFHIDQEFHYKLYLLANVSYYMNMYIRQIPLHPQAEWLITTWAEALFCEGAVSDKDNLRSAFIRDFFNRLGETPYALLKHTHASVSDIPESSDLDLVVCRDDVRSICEFAEKHPLVMKARVNRKSFMSSIELYFRDFSYLSLDLIHSFTRKESVYLDASKILRSAVRNHEGIRVPEDRYGFEYIFLFYLLNGSSVPEKYRRYYAQMSFERRERITNHLNSSYGLALSGIEEVFDFHPTMHFRIRRSLTRLSCNALFSRMVRRLHYYSDTLSGVRSHRGIMISLTGVDGAGKSTIIEELKSRLSSKFRKEVVVLRHRPSLFPILSAWKYGKKEAEQLSINRLPRTGNNKSTFSSTLRFLYYYLDYLIGQVYVYFRYLAQGKIVLYDRYYFDFVVDGQRSNIKLGKRFVASLYRFIAKPDVNVLLYAPIKDILSRKKELSAADIETLTEGYRELFGRLAVRSKGRIYLPIENTDKKSTLTQIEAAFIEAA